MPDQPLVIVDACPFDSALVFDYLGESQHEAAEEGVGDDEFGPADAGVALDEMVGFCGEDDDRGGECPEEAEDKILLGVGIDEEIALANAGPWCRPTVHPQ